MSTTKTQDRVAELRAALSQAESDLADARERLGVAVADDNTEAAAEAREDAARAERIADELRSALPVAERRAREAAQAEAQRQQRVREKAANAARRDRVAQARRVDKALAALGREYDKLIALDSGGRPGDAGRLIRRSRSALAAAMHLQAPQLALALDVRRIPSMHRRALEESTAGSVTEYPEEDAE